MSHFDPPLDEREKFGVPVESVRNVNIDEYESGQSKTSAAKRVVGPQPQGDESLPFKGKSAAVVDLPL
jgi:hypothetical protein